MNIKGIIGHEVQLKRLEAMLDSGLIPQAMIFYGLGGVGKRKIALRLLMSLFCTKEVKPCLVCHDCRLIENNTHPDVLMLLPNEKGSISIGKDPADGGSVRWLISRLSKKSVSGRYGVIIDGVENLSVGGQNALLKTIEEPPENTLIIMITENKRMIPPTILSRATEIYFGRLSSGEISDFFENQNISGKPLGRAAALSGGSAEIASFLADEDNMRELEIILSGVADFIKNRDVINVDLDPLKKKIGEKMLTRILACAFRSMLISELKGEQLLFAGETRMAVKDIINLIKISLALEKSLRVNMLLNISFKGLLYSIDKFPDTGLPDFEDAGF